MQYGADNKELSLYHFLSLKQFQTKKKNEGKMIKFQIQGLKYNNNDWMKTNYVWFNIIFFC